MNTRVEYAFFLVGKYAKDIDRVLMCGRIHFTWDPIIESERESRSTSHGNMKIVLVIY